MRLLPTVAFLIVVSTVVEASSRPRRKPPSKTRPDELSDGDGWPSVKLGEVSPCKTRTPPGETASPLTETAYEDVVDYVTTVVELEVVTKTVTTDVWVTVYPEKLVSVENCFPVMRTSR